MWGCGRIGTLKSARFTPPARLPRSWPSTRVNSTTATRRRPRLVTINAAIQIDNVTHRYGDRLALDGLSLSINAKEIFVFLGPNGGGKTTLFRLLSTLISLQSGEVEVFGRSVS